MIIYQWKKPSQSREQHIASTKYKVFKIHIAEDCKQTAKTLINSGLTTYRSMQEAKITFKFYFILFTSYVQDVILNKINQQICFECKLAE